jgi:hypothetical protein
MGCDGWAWLWEAFSASGTAFRADVAGRGPSRLRINKPRPHNGSGSLDPSCWIRVIGSVLLD